MGDATVKRNRYLNIEISDKGLSEFDGDRRIIFIAKEDVRRVEVHFGSSAERPGLQLIAGILLLALGATGLAMVLASGMRGLRWGVGFMLFGCFGAWFLYETFKKSHYLQVTRHQDVRKLVFRGNFSEADFTAFSKEAGEMGYSLDKSV